MFNIFRDTIAKDLTKIADYFNGVADAGTIFKDKRALAVNRIKNAVLNGDIGGGGGVTPEIEAEIENAQWKTETSTPLFSETVTTVEDLGSNYAVLSYSEGITADYLIVTFNGTEYMCEKSYDEGSGNAAYGSQDFSAFPFVIYSHPDYGNTIYTQSPGTYSISADSVSITYTDTFANAVKSLSGAKTVSGFTDADVLIIELPTSLEVSYYSATITASGTSFTTDTTSIEAGVYYFYRDANNGPTFSNPNFGLAYNERSGGYELTPTTLSNANVDSASIRTYTSGAIPATAIIKCFSLGLPHSIDDSGDVG